MIGPSASPSASPASILPSIASTATHPGAKLERKQQDHDQDIPEVDPADVLAALDEEAEEDGDA